jgi:hypothetical protein
VPAIASTIGMGFELWHELQEWPFASAGQRT